MLKIILEADSYQVNLLRKLLEKEYETCEDHKEEFDEVIGVHKEEITDLLKQL